MNGRLSRFGRRALCAAQQILPSRGPGVTILAYHLVGAGSGTVVDLETSVFREQMRELSERARVRSLPVALHDLVAGRAQANDVVITFDDAFENFREVAWPVLAELALPSTLYVPVGFVSGAADTPLAGAGTLPSISWIGLRQLAETGLLTVGSHSYWHRDLREMPLAALRKDLRDSRRILEDELGTEVSHFCYPQAKWSPAVEREVAQVYESAAIAGGRLNTTAALSPYRLSRVPVRTDLCLSIETVVRSRVWMEEWIAGRVRLMR